MTTITDLTKLPEWQEWQDAFLEAAAKTTTSTQALASVAPLIYAAGQSAARREAGWRDASIEPPPMDGQHINAANFDGSIGFGWYEGRQVPAQTVVHYFMDGFYPSVCENECLHPWPFTHWKHLAALEGK